jgi:hypothetical protein
MVTNVFSMIVFICDLQSNICNVRWHRRWGWANIDGAVVAELCCVLTECRPTHTHVAVILPFHTASILCQIDRIVSNMKIDYVNFYTIVSLIYFYHKCIHIFWFLPILPAKGITILRNYIVTISRSTHLVISRLTLYNIVPLSRATSTILPLHRQASSTIISSISSGYEPKHFLL